MSGPDDADARPRAAPVAEEPFAPLERHRGNPAGQGGDVLRPQGRLTGAGIRDQSDALLSVEDAGAWKPARRAYEYAARTCDTDPADMLLVSVHPWDIDGAARAGLATAWIDRAGSPYPSSFTAPSLRASGLTQLAAQLS